MDITFNKEKSLPKKFSELREGDVFRCNYPTENTYYIKVFHQDREVNAVSLDVFDCYWLDYDEVVYPVQKSTLDIIP